MPDASTGYRRMRSFSGDGLREIAFPLGGIGTGTISLGGRGNLRDFEMFNRPGKGRNLPYTFFSIWCQPQGGAAVARVLERRLLPPHSAGGGLSPAQVSGLPRLREATFTGAYPMAWIDFDDDCLPLQVSLAASNPFIPMDDRASGMPVATFQWTLRNPGDVPVDATVCLSMLNACGYDGQQGLANRGSGLFGQNVNEHVVEGGLHGIRMSTRRVEPGDPLFGTMAIATPWPNVTWRERWERAGWWDDVQDFWDRFSRDGRLPDDAGADPTPDGQTDVGSLGAVVTIPAGGSVTIPFLFTWHFPNFVNHWNAEKEVSRAPMRTWYAGQWPDAWAVALDVHANAAPLEAGTRAFVEAFFASSLPEVVLDAASANASIMRTTTCLRTDDGRFHGFEGCNDSTGCCPMNCTHVWNYEQAVAFLFPELERSVRLTDFGHNTRADGYMAFRTWIPLVPDSMQTWKPAADGQMGTVMKAYREWLQCGDVEWLRGIWPAVRRALEHAWQPGSWDADRDGVMEGEQHNTYDIEFHGPNTMCGLFYLGALRSAEEMARALGDDALAATYRTVFEAGRSGYAGALWNGDYLEQHVLAPDGSGPDEPRYQYGAGCLSDQVLGQWFARVVGLGDLLPEGMARDTLAAIIRHNFRATLADHACVQRAYAVNDEGGLLACTWPRGGRPRYPFPYADEVWTGMEYQVASHCIYEGLVDEGLRVVAAVRDRHDGAKRNPWDECECGHHYARAMSSWALITALSGAYYDAAAGLLRFAPVVSAADFRCFFTAGVGWGEVRLQAAQGGGAAELTAVWGTVSLRTLGLAGVGDAPVHATLDGAPVAARAVAGEVRFETGVTIVAGQTLRVAW